MNKPNRHIFEKEKFLSGNRQRWLVIFLLCMFSILTLDALNLVNRVDSYLTFLTFLSGSFILGYSGTETMKLFSVTSSSQNINQQSDENVNTNSNTNSTSTQVIHNINENLTHNAKEEDYTIEPTK